MTALPSGRTRARRVARWLAWTAGVVLATAGVAAGLLALRLARGPIDLAFLTPRLEEALRPPEGEWAIHLAGTELAWDPDRWELAVRARDVRVTRADGTAIARVPEVLVRLRTLPLLEGRVEVRALDVIGPELRLERDASGDVGLAVGTGEARDDDPLAAFAPGEAGGDLPERIAVRDGTLTIVDYERGLGWEVRGVQIALRRDGGAVEGDLLGRVSRADDDPPDPAPAGSPVRASGRLRLDPLRLELSLGVQDVDVPTLADQLAEAAVRPEVRRVGEALRAIRLRLNARVEATLGPELRLEEARATLAGGQGELALPDPVAVVVGVRSVRTTLAFDAGHDSLTVEALRVDLGGPVLHAFGGMADLGTDRALEATVTVTDLPVDDLGRYWPATVAAEARTWLTQNLSQGTVGKAAVRLAGAVRAPDPAADPAGAPAFTLTALDGDVAWTGLTVRYLPTMPAATAVHGGGSFDADTWTLRVDAGTLDGITIRHGDVRIAGITTGRTTVDVRAAVAGPLADALAVLDHEPLRVAHRIGIAPQGARGSLTGDLALGVPLGEAVAGRPLTVEATARLQGVSLPEALAGHPLTDGELTVAVTRAHADVRGTLRLADTPVTLDWHEPLEAAGERRVHATGRTSTAGRAALGLDVGRWLDGPVPIQVTLTGRGDAPATAAVRADLTAGTFDVPVLSIEKPAGTPGQLDTQLTVRGDTLLAIDHLRLSAGGVRVTATAGRGPDGAAWSDADVEATLPPSTPGAPPDHLRLVLSPAGGGRNAFRLTSESMNPLLRALDARATATGGGFSATGTVDLGTLGIPFTAKVETSGFTLTHAPLLATILGLASLRGIQDTLTDRGLVFDGVTTDLDHQAPALVVSDLIARGNALVVSGRGRIDFQTDHADLRGTLVPSYYGLNKVGSRIPILGTILTGEGGEGIAAIDFDVTGPLDDLRVGVKPSSLAPGILRNLVRLLPQ